MKSKKSIDFPPREFSSVEISHLLMLSAEAHENLEKIGISLVALNNSPILNAKTKKIIDELYHEALVARCKIDEITSIISLEKYLIDESK